MMFDENLCPQLSVTSKNSSELAHRLLMFLVLDLGEIARDFEQHPMTRRHCLRHFLADAFIEVGDRRVEYASDLVKPTGRDTVDAALVFMRLLVGHADHFGELLLGQAEHDTALADATADIVIDRAG
jgi:hypothetical protein